MNNPNTIKTLVKSNASQYRDAILKELFYKTLQKDFNNAVKKVIVKSYYFS